MSNSFKPGDAPREGQRVDCELSDRSVRRASGSNRGCALRRFCLAEKLCGRSALPRAHHPRRERNPRAGLRTPPADPRL